MRNKRLGKKIIAKRDERGSLEGGSLPCATPPHQPRLVAQKTFFLLSCLGEKGGSPFMPSRVWCKRGLGSLYLCLFPLRSFYLFSLLTPVFFVSLIGLTDHSSFTQRGGKRGGRWVIRLRSLGIDTIASQRRNEKVQNWHSALTKAGLKEIKWKVGNVRCYSLSFHVDFADGQVNTDTNVRTIKSVSWQKTGSVSPDLTERPSPVLTFPVIAANKIFKGNN